MNGLQFEVSSRREGVVEVRLIGELDLANASVAEVGMYQLLATSDAETIVVDLSALSFCDAAGLNFFSAAQRIAAAQDKAIVLANPRGIVARVLESVQFGRVVDIAEPDWDEDREISSGGGSEISEES